MSAGKNIEAGNARLNRTFMELKWQQQPILHCHAVVLIEPLWN